MYAKRANSIAFAALGDHFLKHLLMCCWVEAPDFSRGSRPLSRFKRAQENGPAKEAPKKYFPYFSRANAPRTIRVFGEVAGAEIVAVTKLQAPENRPLTKSSAKIRLGHPLPRTWGFGSIP